MQTTLSHTRDENYNVRTFWFKPPSPFAYTAGQFIELHLPHKNPDGRGEKHWFTLSSSPSEKLLSISTKYAGEKSSSFKKTLWSLSPGAKVSMSDPMGDFVLPKDKNIPLVFVAGGIGVTPFRSMVKWLLDSGDERQIQFIWAINEPRDEVFADLFISYGIKPKLFIKSAGQGLTGQKILDLADDYQNTRIYISGPEPMVEAFMDDLEKLGIPKNDLIGDFFPGYPPI